MQLIWRESDEECYGRALLSELAETIGGGVFEVRNLNDLPDVASKIGMELRNQYVLGYRQKRYQAQRHVAENKSEIDPSQGLATTERLR